MTVEKYVKEIGNYLKCTKQRKQEIMKQIQSDVEISIEGGKSVEDVIKEMGSSSQIAMEFNENFSEDEKKAVKKKKRMVIISIVAAIVVALVILVSIFLPKANEISESEIFSEAGIKVSSEEIINILDSKDYDKLSEYMNDNLKKAVSNDDLDKAREQISGNFGERESFGSMYMVEIVQLGKHYATSQFTASYENVSVTYTLSFDEDMKLSGIYMK